jgi:hypothetical protein
MTSIYLNINRLRVLPVSSGVVHLLVEVLSCVVPVPLPVLVWLPQPLPKGNLRAVLSSK